MELRYRSLAESEIGEAANVFLTTLADLARRNGMAAPTSFTRQTVEPLFLHTSATGIFQVAEADGRIVSICNAVVRDHIWFLAMFWTLPEFQQKRLGVPLLRRVWEEGRRQGATLGLTWSSIDFTAIATYMKLGMLPGSQIFTFCGTPALLPAPSPGYELEPLEQAHAVRIDAQVRGTGRDVDHAYWAFCPGSRLQVSKLGEIVGYFQTSGGVIGPAGWSEPSHARAVIGLALQEASRQASEVRLMTTGSNHSAIKVALECGLKLAGSAHLLLTQPLGALDQYLPSGPALF